MKPFLFLFAVLFPVLAAIADDIGVGSDSPAAITIPEAFHRENENATTLFVMPRKNDTDGPTSLRLSLLQDLAEENPPPEKLKEMLKSIDPKSELVQFGKNIATTQVEEGLDDEGAKWRFTHYVVCADQLVVVVTMQTIVSREKEPQCHELLEAIPQILASLKRKKAQ